MRVRIAGFVAAVQVVLFAAHWFVYETWSTFRGGADPEGVTWLQAAVALLSVSFVAATLLAFRSAGLAARLLYRVASVWAGVMNFLLPASAACWIVDLTGRLAGFPVPRPALAAMVFGAAVLASLYGMLNARRLRVRRIQVRLPNLPASWNGRVAALVSDVHLGHVNGRRFTERIAAVLTRLQPDITFITGDLFDGTRLDAQAAAAPLGGLHPALGTFFVTGNHEEFGDPGRYLDAVRSAGVRVLRSEKAEVDGVQIVGVSYADSTQPERLRSALRQAALDPARANILLSHAPHGLAVAESEGVSLQLSGHTHAGQVFPFTWITRRIFREFTYGLARFGGLTVYTTSGAGTWGPPMRVGTSPEIVLIEFA